MLTAGPAKKVTIHLNADTVSQQDFLSREILALLFQRSAGATVSRLEAGFGSHHRMHSAGGGIDADRNMPIQIEFIETQANIERLVGLWVQGDANFMISLTRKCQYALRAVFYLAHQHGHGPTPITQIAAATNAPLGFLESILLQLRNAGILESRRGPYGGYVFAMAPQEVSVGAIVRTVDGPLASLACLGTPGIRKCQDCTDGENCQIRRFMQEIHDSAAAILDRTFLLPGSAGTNSLSAKSGAIPTEAAHL